MLHHAVIIAHAGGDGAQVEPRECDIEKQQLGLQHVGPLLREQRIGDKPALLYDGLSTKANKTFVLSSHHPVEILVKLDKWSKVRDSENSVGWMENAFIGDKRFVQVASGSAEIRVAPNGSAAIAFEAQRGVLLEPTGSATVDGWLPVRHRDGQSGFVRLTQVWGA